MSENLEVKKSVHIEALRKMFKGSNTALKGAGVAAISTIGLVELIKSLPSNIQSELAQALNIENVDVLEKSFEWLSNASGEVIQTVANNPIEVSAGLAVVFASNFIGSKDVAKRLTARVTFVLMQLVYMKIAVEHEMWPMLIQEGYFIATGAMGIKNELMQEVFSDEQKEKIAAFKAKIGGYKDSAIEKGRERLSKVYKKITPEKKEDKKKTLMSDTAKVSTASAGGGVVTGAAACSQSDLLEKSAMYLVDNAKEVWSYIEENLSQVLGTGVMLKASAHMAKADLSNRIKGYSGFLIGNLIYAVEYMEKGLAGQFVQSIYSAGGAASGVANSIEEIRQKEGREATLSEIFGTEGLAQKGKDLKAFFLKSLEAIKEKGKEKLLGEIKEEAEIVSEVISHIRHLGDDEEKPEQKETTQNAPKKQTKKAKAMHIS